MSCQEENPSGESEKLQEKQGQNKILYDTVGMSLVLVLNESEFYPRSQSHYKLFSSVSSMVKNIDVFTDIA